MNENDDTTVSEDSSEAEALGARFMEPPALLSREHIIQVAATHADVRYDYVPVPEWIDDTGATHVRLRSLSGEERDRYELELINERDRSKAKNFKNARTKLIVLSVVDAAGAPMFSKADIPFLEKLNTAALQRIWTKCQELSGFSDKDIDELIEEAKEDFAKAPSRAS